MRKKGREEEEEEEEGEEEEGGDEGLTREKLMEREDRQQTASPRQDENVAEKNAATVLFE